MIPSLRYSSLEFLGLQLQTHGLFAASGLLVWYCASLYLARKRGLDTYPLLVSIPVAAVVGAITGHQLFLLTSPQRVPTSSAPFDLWAGQSMQGVVVGGAIAVCVALIVTIRIAHPKASGTDKSSLFAQYADTVGAMLPLGIALTRIGCFLIHEKPGRQTSFVLGVRGGCSDGSMFTACHDLALYEVIATALFAVFACFRLSRDVRVMIAPSFVIYYGVFRAMVSLLEDRNPPSFSVVGQAYLATAALGVVMQVAATRVSTRRATPPA